MEAALSSLVNQASAFLLAGVVGHRNGNIHPSIAVYQPFEASDGPFVVAAANDALWRSVCEVIDRPELADDERFADNGRRREHVEELRKLLDEAFSRRPAEEWIALLQEAGVPAGPINDVGEAFAMATELGLDPIVDIDGLRLLRPPVRLSRTPATVRLPPPALGEHDDELRAWLSS
jgi:crotonobetainyl-CoA:carnitine CoA-transferase CaiB-like acyl-CoA transferase